MNRTIYRLFCLGLIVGLSACSGGPRRSSFNSVMRGSLNPVTVSGGRIAAVLENTENCNPTTDPFAPAGRNGAAVFPGQQATGNAFGTQQPTGEFQGQRGYLEILALDEGDMQHVRASSMTIGNSPSNSYVTSGIVGRAIGGVSVAGLTADSWVVADQSGLVLASMTNYGSGQVWAWPVYANGGLGTPYQLNVGPHPKHISVGNTPLGEYAVVATDSGYSLILMDRTDEMGIAVPRVFRVGIYSDQGQAISSAFSPSGEFVALGLNGSRGAGAAGQYGKVVVCDLRKQQTLESLSESMLRSPFGLDRGCHEIQRVRGVPLRVAVSSNQLVALTSMGPVNLAIPGISDMTADPDSMSRMGALLNFNGARGNADLRYAVARDMALLPFTSPKNIVTIRGTSLETWAMDNALEQGRQIDGFQVGTKPMALGLDPGPDPTFLLVADAGSALVYVGRLDQIALGMNTLTDFVRTRACPFSVAVRGRSQ